MANRRVCTCIAAALLLIGSLAAENAPTTQPAHTPASATAAAARSHGAELPAGTAIYFRVNKGLSSERNRRGDTFSGVVTRKVVIEGRTIIPIGCVITGHVARTSSPRRIKGHPSIDLRPDEITFPDGTRRRLAAIIVDSDRPRLLHVDDEGRILGRGRSGRDNLETLVATTAGAGTGALIAGGPGALIGASAGATVSTVHWLARHRSVEIAAGTTLIAELNRAMPLTAAPRPQSEGN